MPWFGRGGPENDDQQRALERQAQDQQASLEALQRGGIPVQATRRLQDLAAHPGLFTSDLSVSEFVLSRQMNLQPLSQVMGSCVYHVGWQYLPGSWWGSSQEMSTITEAYNEARRLALGRMEEEAREAGADLVVGVHIERQRYEWGSDLIEFAAVGTAVRLPRGMTAPSSRLTTLSGQEFWQLYHAGYWPAGVVGSTTVYYQVASWRTQWAQNSWRGGYNQELQDFTQGLYRARHLATSRLHAEASRYGASGLIAVNIEQDQEEREVDTGNDQRRTDMIFTFHILGTAIVERTGDHHVDVMTAVPLD